MIQQKSMHRKSETRRSHSIQQSRRRRMNVRSQNSDATRLITAQQCRKDRETCGSGTTQWSWRSYRAEYHTVVLETSVCRAVVSIQRERQTLCSVFMNCEWTDIFQPKDNGEQKIHE